jgi:hypothetical protein
MPTRRLAALAALTLTVSACSGRPSSSTGRSQGPTLVPTAGPSVEPVALPSGTPPSYDAAVAVAALPPTALVPNGTMPSAIWTATAPDGTQFAIVAFAASGGDPLRRARGLIVWRRFPGSPPWRPVLGFSDAADAGIVQIQALIGDVTGDGWPDAITFEDGGGSGVCGTWRVLDLSANAQIYRQHRCDTTLDVSTDPAGLALHAAVYRSGDAHCCPSETRTTILTYADGRWTVASRVVTPNA